MLERPGKVSLSLKISTILAGEEEEKHNCAKLVAPWFFFQLLKLYFDFLLFRQI